MGLKFEEFLKRETKKNEIYLESLSTKDLLQLKRYTLDEKAELTIPALISLLLLESNSKKIEDEEVLQELQLFNYLDDSFKVTEKAKEFLKESTTKEKVRTLLFS